MLRQFSGKFPPLRSFHPPPFEGPYHGMRLFDGIGHGNGSKNGPAGRLPLASRWRAYYLPGTTRVGRRFHQNRAWPNMLSTSVASANDVDWLIGTLTRAKVLDADRARSALAEFRIEHPRGDSSDAIAFFIAQGILTRYQAECAAAGEADKLQLGPYLLLEPLGHGSLGAVFQGIHRGTRERFAIKTLPLRSLWKVVEAKKLADRIAAMPAHPAVVPFADVNTAAGSHYLAWPFVAGETLEGLVRKFGPLAPADAARIMAEVADGLAVCHAADVVHGLLKPSNLMLGTDRHPRILDLGVGAILADNIDDESMIDTISTAGAAMSMMDYSPPETIADPNSHTPSGDIYSFGCVLYYLLAGMPPFPDGNVVDKMIAHQTKAPPSIATLLPGISSALSDFVDRMLAKPPEIRPTASQVRDELRLLQTQLRDHSSTSSKLSVAMEKIKSALADVKWNGDYESSGNISQTHTARPPAARAQDNEGAINFDDTVSDLASRGPDTPPHSIASILARADRNAIPPVQPALADTRKIRLGYVTATPDLAASARNRPAKGFDLPPAPIGHDLQPSSDTGRALTLEVEVPIPPQFPNTFLSRLKFWKPKRYTVQISVFGPRVIDPGQRVTFTLYAHLPESFANAKTLCRAMRADAELVGAGFLDVPVVRGTDLAMSMALSNAGLAKAETKIHWVGQLQPRTYDVFVPWECPEGVMSGVVTACIAQKMVGSIPVRCLIRPRSS